MKEATHAEVKPRKLRLGLSKIIRVGKDTEDQTGVTLLRREDTED